MKKHNIKKILTTALIFTLILTVLLGCSKGSTYPIYESSSASMATEEAPNALSEEQGQAENILEKIDENKNAEVTEVSKDFSGLERKIVYTANISMETDEYDATLTNISNILKQNEGYIETSQREGAPAMKENTLGYQRQRSYVATFRVPSKNYSKLVDELDALGYTYYFDESTEDLSLSYSDSEIRKKTLETEAERVLYLLEKATKMEDIIVLERRLTEIRNQVEMVERNLRGIDANVNFATVHLSIDEVGEYLPTPKVEQGIFSRMSIGFIRSLNSIKESLGDFLVYIVTNLPYIIILGLIILVFIFIFKRAKKNIKITGALKKAIEPSLAKEKPVKQEKHSNQQYQQYQQNYQQKNQTILDENAKKIDQKDEKNNDQDKN